MNKIEMIISKIFKNKFIISVSALASGSMIAHLISVLTTPIMSRIYSTNDFGYNALIISTATIIIGFITLGLSSAIMAPDQDNESDSVLSVSLSISFVLGTVIVVGGYIALYFFKVTPFGIIKNIDWILLYLCVLLLNFSGHLNIYANRKKMNKVLFYNSIIGTSATLLVTIPLGLFKMGGIGITIGTISASLVQVAQMLYFTKPHLKIPSKDEIIFTIKKYKDFVKYQYPSNFIGSFSYQLPNQLISSSFGTTNLGTYNMTEKMLGIPSRLIAAPIGTVYFRTVSEHHKKGINFSDFTFKLILGIMILAFIPLVTLIIWGGEIFSFVLGKQWYDAGILSSFLTLVYIMYFCETTTSYCRVAIGRQKANLLVSFFRLSITMISLYIGIIFFKSFYLTVVSFSIGIILYLIVDMYINFHYLGKNKNKYLIFSFIYVSLIFFLWILFGRI